MQTILNLTVMANDVAPQFLEYVCMENERYTEGRIFYLFNIMDPAGKGRPQPGVQPALLNAARIQCGQQGQG